MIRTRMSRLALLLMVGIGLGPVTAWGQDYAPPDPVFPLPLFHDRPETGGLFVDAEFVLMQQTNPLHHQLIGQRGLVDFDGSITADLNGRVVNPVNGTPPLIVPGAGVVGTRLGSFRPALYADDAGGPGSYQPGFKIGAGWKFQSGWALEASWTHLFEVKYSAVASIVPPDFNAGPILADSFLFAPVFNFPNQYAGPPQKLAIGNPGAAFGIWNGASIMQIQFTQRFDIYEMNARIPIFDTDCCRCYGLAGPRMVWQWERFKWRTTSENFDGNFGPADVADYTNVVSNRMYGGHFGGGTEWRLGDTPAGTFAISLDVQVAILVDFVREQAKYERADFSISASRNRTDYTIVPELQGQLNLWWYPIEGIQLRVGYDAMAFFNTVASPNPVSFNYGGLDPPFQKGVFRLIEGLNAGVGLVF